MTSFGVGLAANPVTNYFNPHLLKIATWIFRGFTSTSLYKGGL